MITVKCPYCGEEIEVFDWTGPYEWYFNHAKRFYTCESCKSIVAVELEATIAITSVEPYAESEQFAQERYIQHCDELVDLHRDKEMGFE